MNFFDFVDNFFGNTLSKQGADPFQIQILSNELVCI